ncbi:hypothetical protein [Haloferula rosea]|nr:hypothetical protein [Haloferula rosea]
MAKRKPALKNDPPNWDLPIGVTWIAAPFVIAGVLHLLNFF